MTARYTLTLLAESDLDQTWDYVAEHFGFDVADRVLDSLHDAFKLLGENPDIGHYALDRVEIGRVGGQAHNGEPALLAREVRTGLHAPVRIDPVPEEEDMAANVTP